MTKLQKQVLEFHKAFDYPVADSPTIPPDDRVRFRAAFIVEECLEFLVACFELTPVTAPTGPTDFTMLEDAEFYLKTVIKHAVVKVDLPLAVDALADIDYVVEGTRLEFGVNGEPVADEVHRANMTKVGAPRTPEGRTLKPPGWKAPDIAGELEVQRYGILSLERIQQPKCGICDGKGAVQRDDWVYCPTECRASKALRAFRNAKEASDGK